MSDESAHVDLFLDLVYDYIKEVYGDRGYSDIYMQRAYHVKEETTDDDCNPVYNFDCIVEFSCKTDKKMHVILAHVDMSMDPDAHRVITEEIHEMLHTTSMTSTDLMAYAHIMSDYDPLIRAYTNAIKNAYSKVGLDTKNAFFEFLDSHTVWNEKEAASLLKAAAQTINLLSLTRPDKTFLDKE